MRCVTYLFVSVYRPVTTVSHDCTVSYEVFVQSNQFVLAFIYFFKHIYFFLVCLSRKMLHKSILRQNISFKAMISKT